jgi:hypothetical protein
VIAKRILRGVLMLIIGTVGIVPLFVVGEGTGSGFAAYAAVTVLFAVFAYVFGRSDPRAALLCGALICAPVFLLSIMGPDSGGAGLAMLMVVVTVGVAAAGARRGVARG